MLLDLGIKATVLLAIGFGLTRALRQASAASRHTVWTTVFVAMLLLPLARQAMPEWSVISIPDRISKLGVAASGESKALRSASVEGNTSAAVSSPGPSWWPSTSILTYAWGTGAALYLFWMYAGMLGTRRLEAAASLVVDERVQERAARAASRLGVRRSVRLLAVSKDVMPSTWGLVAPRVLLPKGAPQWPDTQLDAVLTHELSHVVRGDAVSHLSARLATAMWWWHPLMWLAARQARFERERACDDLVLTQGARASDYAENLVTFVSSLEPELPATMAMARRSQLEGRVMAILKSDVNRRGVSQAGFLAALLVAALVWPLAAARATEQEQDPLRVGGAVKAPTKIKDVRPIYPPGAEAEGRQGVTIIEARIDTFGNVAEARVIRSIGEDFDAAATDAVMQWRFTPTTLNGRAVPVIMTVTVNFTLDSGTVTPPPPPPPPPPPGSVAGEPPPPPAPPAPPAPKFGDGIRIGGEISAPIKIKDVKPVYPELAQQSMVSGIVILEIRVDAEGNVTDAKVIRPVALLSEAARDAVMQWKYTPTLLNGQAVPVLMTVTVNFSLQ